MLPVPTPPRAPSAAHVHRILATGVFVGLRCEDPFAVVRYWLPRGFADLYYGRDPFAPEFLRLEGAAEDPS